MAQKEKFEDLVNRVELEARQFATFDDYLAAKDAQETEWTKSASGVVENSSSDSNEKVVETVESSPQPSAEPASAPTVEKDVRAKEMEKPGYIANGAKSEPLAHPLAPNVTAEEPIAAPVLEAPRVVSDLRLDSIPWAGQASQFINEVAKVDHTEPEWWKGIFNAGKTFSVDAATLDEVIAHYRNQEDAIQQIRCSQLGIRAGLEQRLLGMNADQRAKAMGDLNRSNRSARVGTTNKKAADKMKVERAKAPEKAAGIKLADTLGETMGLDYDEIIAGVKKAGKLDALTQEYIDKKFPKAGA